LQGYGDGAISAFVNSLGLPLRIVDYHEHAIGSGTDTRAACYVEVKMGDHPSGFGVATDRDIVTASFKAVLSAVNRHIAQQLVTA
jgi:2-isopropylmalate synthase